MSSSRVLLRRDSNVLRRSYLRDGVHTRARTMFDDAANACTSLLMRGQYDPTLEINYVDDPRLAVGETFTRATLATTVDFEGRVVLCQSGEARFYGMRRIENVCLFSEDLTNAAWTKLAGSATSATRFKEDATNAVHGVARTLTNLAGAVIGFQCEVARAPGSSRDIAVQIANGADQVLVAVSLADGSVVSQFVGGVHILDSIRIFRSNDRWCIQLVVRNCVAGSTVSATTVASGLLSYVGNNISETIITRLQAEIMTGQGTFVCGEYVSNGVLPAPYHGPNVDGVRYFVTNYSGTVLPRYTNTATVPGRCGLFRERASANLLLQSAFAASWTAVTATLTPATTTAPDGTTAAATLKEDATVTALHAATQAITLAANGNLAMYVWAKRGVGTRHLAIVAQAGADYFRTYFDLSNGTVGAHDAGGTGVWTSADVVPFVGGYYLCRMWGKASTTVTNPTIGVRMASTTAIGGDVYSGDNASTIILWGAQAENLDHPTSYIPTAAATVTRNKDSLTGPSFAGAWCNQSAGAVYAEAILDWQPLNSRLVSTSGTAGNVELLAFTTANAGALGTFDGTGGALTANVQTPGALTKAAARYTVPGSAAVVLNNGTEATSVNGNFAFTGFAIGEGAATEMDCRIGRIWWFPLDIGASRLKPLTA